MTDKPESCIKSLDTGVKTALGSNSDLANPCLWSWGGEFNFMGLGSVCAFVGFVFWVLFFFFFFGHAAWLAGSQFPDQGLNLEPGNKSMES